MTGQNFPSPALEPYDPAAVLCYIDAGVAYFTTQDLDKQWGDDWDDAPYEHNAGAPYGPHREGESWKIHEARYRADLDTPADRAGGNSNYSVKDINSGAVAWLTRSRWSNEKPLNIPAGTRMADFIRLILEDGGDVYLPVALKVTP